MLLKHTRITHLIELIHWYVFVTLTHIAIVHAYTLCIHLLIFYDSYDGRNFVIFPYALKTRLTPRNSHASGKSTQCFLFSVCCQFKQRYHHLFLSFHCIKMLPDFFATQTTTIWLVITFLCVYFDC